MKKLSTVTSAVALLIAASFAQGIRLSHADVVPAGAPPALIQAIAQETSEDSELIKIDGHLVEIRTDLAEIDKRLTALEKRGAPRAHASAGQSHPTRVMCGGGRHRRHRHH